MSYNYQEIKPRIFEQDNQELFLSIRDRVKLLLKEAGAVRLQQAALLHNSGDSWTMIACMDRLVELGEIKELPTNGAGQFRVFIAA